MRKLLSVALVLCILTVFVSGASARTWNTQEQTGSASSSFFGHNAALGQYQGMGISGTGVGTQEQAMDVNSGFFTATATGSQLQDASVTNAGSFAHLEQASIIVSE